VDIIKEVGPGGNFLAHDHTLNHFRKVNWFPRITNRKKWEDWMDDGGKDMRQRANETAREILAKHYPRHLPDDVAQEIDKMARLAQKRAIESQRSLR